MPLTEEQFNKAQAAGFSVDQIIGFEKQRQENSLSIAKPKNRFTLKSSQPYSSYTYGDVLKDTGKTIVNNFADVGDATLGVLNQTKEHPFQAAGNIASGAVNTLIHPIASVKAVGSDLVNKIQNAPNKPVDALLTGLTDVGLAKSGFDLLKNPKTYQAIGKAGNVIKNMKPVIYNDQLIANTTKSAISKINNVIQPLKDAYTKILEPYQQQVIDSNTFKQALNSVPSGMRKQFAEDYGTKILDASGNPTTTLDGLQRMEQHLKNIAYSQKFGERMGAAEFDAARAAGKVKDIRISELPDDVKLEIKSLDKKYGPAIEASDALLPKLADKNGVPNTKFLFTTFKDPSRAGMRDYLLNLKNIGVDLMPEIKTTRGWVSRQGTKDFVKRNVGRVVEGGIIGGILKH